MGDIPLHVQSTNRKVVLPCKDDNIAIGKVRKEGKHIVYHKNNSTACCLFSLIDKFDKMARDALKNCPYTISLPDSGTVFDYYVDCKIGAFMHWREKQPEKNRKVVASYTIIPEVRFFLETLPSKLLPPCVSI